MKENMKRKILIGVLTIIFSLILFSLTMQANASEEVTQVGSWDVSADDGESNVTATLYSDGSFIISGTGAMNTDPSYGSEDRPYNDNETKIKTAKIEKGVTSIGRSAFYGCSNLESIEIPEGVTGIGDYAFRSCTSLTSIEIPSSVTSIGYYAFYGCSSLTNINVESNNKKYSSESGVLFNKEKTNIIKYPEGKKETEYQIPEGVTSIGESAFRNCTSLESIDIPEGVTSIGAYAFDSCSSLTSIEIPEGVTSIGRNAFYCCKSLESIEIPEEVTYIGGHAFGYCRSLEVIEIPEGVRSIGEWAFASCSSLTSIKIPSSVTYISFNAFDSCRSLESIEIPEGVTDIGKNAFARCTSLTNIEIPEGVTSIGDYAFYSCSSLTNINVESNNKKYSSENGVLFNKEKTNIIQYPGGKKETEYQIPEGVTSIGNSAFRNCTSLESIEIPSSVTSIGYNAFYECKSLTSIEIPEGVTSIGSEAFYSCSSLTSIEIPEGVTSIENGAFEYCTSLESIEIPEGVTSIGNEAFSYCRSLESIEIPSSVTNIGDDAFYGAKLTMVVASGTENVQEIELPNIIKRAMKEEDILYTANDFRLTKCSLSEDKTKLVVDTEVASSNEVSLKVTEGALKGLTVVVVVVPSGTITYSTTQWTNKDIIAKIYVANGETITNNNGKDTYTFTENGTFTFKYLTEEGEEKEATATVENIEELSIKNYEVTEENGEKYIESIKAGTTIQQVLNNIETNGTAKVYKGDTKITDENKESSTAMSIKITWGTVDEETYTLVVTGDLSGDGQIGNVDLLKIARYNAGLDTSLEGAYLKAADVYRDGAYGDNKDLLKTARVLAGLENL